MSNRESTQRTRQPSTSRSAASAFGLEGLEGRRLLSASLHHGHHGRHSSSSTSSTLITSPPTLLGGSTPPVSTTGTPISTIGSLLGHIVQFQNAPAAVQTTLQANAPAGVTISPTQNVFVLTTKTTTDYTLSLLNAGTRTTITVNSSGTLVNLITSSTIQFSAAPSAVQAGMQALAPSGVTIAATQNVIVNTVNGVTTYLALVVYGTKHGFLGQAKLIIVNAEGDPINNGTSAI